MQGVILPLETHLKDENGVTESDLEQGFDLTSSLCLDTALCLDDKSDAFFNFDLYNKIKKLVLTLNLKRVCGIARVSTLITFIIKKVHIFTNMIQEIRWLIQLPDG